MLLAEFFTPALNEGGAVFPETVAINKEFVPDIVKQVKKLLSGLNVYPDIGSAGYKIASGDMDIMVDAQEVIDKFGVADVKAAKKALQELLNKKNLETKLSGQNVHVKMPLPNNAFGQVDIMVVSDAKLVAPYHQHGLRGSYDDPGFKGSDIFIVIASIAKSMGLKFEPFGAKLVRRDTGDLVARSRDDVARILLNPNATGDDLNSVKAILASLENDPKKDEKLAQARADAEKGLIKLPEDTNMKIAEVSSLDTDIDYAPGPDQEYDKKELQAVLTKAMGTLDPKEERIIRMHVYQDMTFDEIGKKYGVTRQRIRDIFMKGIRKLRHKSRNAEIKTFAPETKEPNQLKATDIAKTIAPRPFAGSQPHPFKGKLVGSESKINERDTRSTDNFTIDDIKQLERIEGLNDIKRQAIALITKPSKRPITPEKQTWLKNAVMSKKDKMSVIKLMYDLMLGGEGMKVIGSKSSYRQKFGEDANPTDKITMDIPLFVRMLEYAREDAKTDMDLHSVTERAIELMKEHDYLCMDNYNDLVGGEATGGEKTVDEAKKKITAKNDPCWPGYHMVGTKKKDGREVPNCVPGKKG